MTVAVRYTTTALRCVCIIKHAWDPKTRHGMLCVIYCALGYNLCRRHIGKDNGFCRPFRLLSDNDVDKQLKDSNKLP